MKLEDISNLLVARDHLRLSVAYMGRIGVAPVASNLSRALSRVESAIVEVTSNPEANPLGFASTTDTSRGASV